MIRMKTLYLIGGPMGVGKTTVCQQLKRLLPNCVLLDGDWCWDMSPFQVTEETKAMVVDNILHLLNNFLHCSAFENVVFCWVLHRQDLLQTLLRGLSLDNVRVRNVSLVCAEDALRQRLLADVSAGLRQADVVARSLGYLPLYAALDTQKLDTTALTPREVALVLTRPDA